MLTVFAFQGPKRNSVDSWRSPLMSSRQKVIKDYTLLVATGIQTSLSFTRRCTKPILCFPNRLLSSWSGSRSKSSAVFVSPLLFANRDTSLVPTIVHLQNFRTLENHGQIVRSIDVLLTRVRRDTLDRVFYFSNDERRRPQKGNSVAY